MEADNQHRLFPAESKIEQLPFITADLEGIGGIIKAEAGRFVVEEIPLYEPGDTGDHVYLRLRREGMNTKDICRELAKVFGLREEDIGCAGQKDKHAVAVQTFSLYMPKLAAEEVARRTADQLPVEVLWARRHVNKIRTGHLLGNSFAVVVEECCDDALEKARAVWTKMGRTGLPNFYGPQRFGAGGENIARGKAALQGRGPKGKWLRRFLLSSYQAYMFNHWLAERMKCGWFDRLLTGDVAKKTDTGGLFTVEDAEVEAPRFAAGEITYTGPIYGAKMRWAEGEPGALERRIMEDHQVTESMLKKARLDGSRRPARLNLDGLTVEEHEAGLLFRFALPKGAYATTVIREFTKGDEPSLPETV